MNIELTQEDRENLIKFLRKAPLIGDEVPEYTRIVDALNKPVFEQMEKANMIKKQEDLAEKPKKLSKKKKSK